MSTSNVMETLCNDSYLLILRLQLFDLPHKILFGLKFFGCVYFYCIERERERERERLNLGSTPGSIFCFALSSTIKCLFQKIAQPSPPPPTRSRREIIDHLTDLLPVFQNSWFFVTRNARWFESGWPHSFCRHFRQLGRGRFGNAHQLDQVHEGAQRRVQLRNV